MLQMNTRQWAAWRAAAPLLRSSLGRLLDGPAAALRRAEPRATSSHWSLRPALLEALLAAGTEPRRREIVRAQLATLGFDALGFGCLDISRGAPVVRAFCGAYADPAWVARYFARRYPAVDPRLRAIERSNLPCLWTLPELARQPVAAAQRADLGAMVDDLRESGVRSGLMLAVPAPPGQARRFISLLGPRPQPARLDDAALGRVLMLALCLEECHGTLRPPTGPGDEAAPTGELSATQAQILDLLARGMGDKQIAARLDLSLHNVDYHLRRLRKRFGVRNRVQLMQAALQASAAP